MLRAKMYAGCIFVFTSFHSIPLAVSKPSLVSKLPGCPKTWIQDNTFCFDFKTPSCSWYQWLVVVFIVIMYTIQCYYFGIICSFIDVSKEQAWMLYHKHVCYHRLFETQIYQVRATVTIKWWDLKSTTYSLGVSWYF